MRGFRIGRLFGIDIEIHKTWPIIFVLVAVILSMSYFPQALPEASKTLYWLFGILTSLAFFASVIFHEMAHSLVARKFGVSVKRITLFILGGVAQLEKESPSAKAEFWVAIAGPLSSFVLGGFFWWLGFYSGLTLLPIAQFSLFYLAFINILLAVFNLIPGFPLDGGRVFRAIWWHFSKDLSAATRIACKVGKGFGWFFMAGGIFLAFFTGNFINGIWFLFIGWFLKSMAGQSLTQHLIQEALAGAKVRDLQEPISITNPAMISRIMNNNWVCQSDEGVTKVLERMTKVRHPEFFVMEGNEVIARIAIEVISQYIRERKRT